MRRGLRIGRVTAAVTTTLAILGFLLGPLSPLAAQESPDGRRAAVVEFRGSGWGHGVGMSQFGAYGRAVAGASAEEILSAYYPGTTIGRTRSAIDDLRVSLGTSGEVGIDVSGPTIMAIDGVGVALVPGSMHLTVRRPAEALEPVVEVIAPGLCEPGQCVGGVVQLALTPDHPVGLATTGHRYDQGVLSLSPDGDLVHTIVGSLNLEQYMLGLAEMPSSWPEAALDAQAIAGRSYAYNRALVSRGRGGAFDIGATTSDQVYVGIEKVEGPSGDRWRAAVARTAGRYVLIGDSPALTVYSSSNGGWTETSEYVFGGARTYLQATPDPWDAYQNPNAVWGVRFSGADVGLWLAPLTGDIGELVDVAVVGPTGLSGRTDRAVVRVTGTDGSADIDGHALRQAINANAGATALRSSRFTIDVTPLPDLDTAVLESAVVVSEPEPTFDPVALALADHPAPRPDDAEAPRGALAVVGGELGEIVTGWAVDPDQIEGLSVRITVDGVPLAVVTANQPTSYGPTDSGPIGFSTPVVIPPGLHAVCADTFDVAGAEITDVDALPRPILLGCVLAETLLPQSLAARP